ncbi:hypothetical protein LSAT2_021257 [Lamellibrachia satsuma]|nr:hypothetical protein LSAT2_021257 [Lamellibrachia satsuma]
MFAADCLTTSSVASVQAELTQETLKTVEQMEVSEKQTAHKYHAEPPRDMPYIPPNTSLTQNAGYLSLRSKQALIASKWERCYFFIQGGNLMCQTRNERRAFKVISAPSSDSSVIDDQRPLAADGRVWRTDGRGHLTDYQ